MTEKHWKDQRQKSKVDIRMSHDIKLPYPLFHSGWTRPVVCTSLVSIFDLEVIMGQGQVTLIYNYKPSFKMINNSIILKFMTFDGFDDFDDFGECYILFSMQLL